MLLLLFFPELAILLSCEVNYGDSNASVNSIFSSRRANEEPVEEDNAGGEEAPNDTSAPQQHPSGVSPIDFVFDKTGEMLQDIEGVLFKPYLQGLKSRLYGDEIWCWSYKEFLKEEISTKLETLTARQVLLYTTMMSVGLVAYGNYKTVRDENEAKKKAGVIETPPAAANDEPQENKASQATPASSWDSVWK